MSKASLFQKFILLGLCIVLMTGCNTVHQSYDSYEKPAVEESFIMPVDSYSAASGKVYENEGIVPLAVATYESEDRLCRIIAYKEYYDVTLDYEKGDSFRIGKAYAEAVLLAFPEYSTVLEPYIFENIRGAFGDGGFRPEAVEERINTLYGSLDDKYKKEIDGFATGIASDLHGIEEDGRISYEEAMLIQMIPDALRPTSCSALSLWGEKTESGQPITLRCLEWNLGSENQMGMINAVVHFKDGNKTVTCIGILGLLDVISAINDDGVFVAILDVGSNTGIPYVSEGKKCYTFDIRYALEEYDNAKAVGEYMVGNSADYTWCHNLIITDKNHSYCAEDCVREVAEAGEGFSVLRDTDSELMEGLCWDSADSLCVVNSFAVKGNQDGFEGSEANLVRFAKYNEWVKAQDKFSVKEVKEMITQEAVNQYDVQTVHRIGVVHIILVDYATRSIQVAFTGTEGPVDQPDFIHIGEF